MAWYSLRKWYLPWRKTNYFHWIKWYRGFLYNQWFSSLSEEEQQKENERVSKLRRDRELSSQQAWDRINYMYDYLNSRTDNRVMEYMDSLASMNRIAFSSRSRYW